MSSSLLEHSSLQFELLTGRAFGDTGIAPAVAAAEVTTALVAGVEAVAVQNA